MTTWRSKIEWLNLNDEFGTVKLERQKLLEKIIQQIANLAMKKLAVGSVVE